MVIVLAQPEENRIMEVESPRKKVINAFTKMKKDLEARGISSEVRIKGDKIYLVVDLKWIEDKVRNGLPTELRDKIGVMVVDRYLVLGTQVLEG
jgi:hypothetical protein